MDKNAEENLDSIHIGDDETNSSDRVIDLNDILMMNQRILQLENENVGIKKRERSELVFSTTPNKRLMQEKLDAAEAKKKLLESRKLLKEAIKSLEEEFDVEIPVYVTIGKLKDSGEEKLRVTCKSCEDEKFKLEETERTSKIQSQIKSRQDKLMKLANKNAREFPDAIHLKRDVIQVAGKEKLGVLRCGICNGIIKGSKTPCSKDIKQHMKSNMHSSGRLTEKARELNMVLIDRCLNDYIKASGSELELSLDAIKFRVHLTRAFLAMGIPLCKADNVELQEFLQQYTKYRFAGRRGLTRWVELVSRIEREEKLQNNCKVIQLI